MRDRKSAVSTALAAAIVIIIVIAAIAGVYLYTTSGHTTSSSSSSTSSPSSTSTSTSLTSTSHSSTTSTTTPTQTATMTLGPKNASVLVDETNGEVPESLDPAYAFVPQDASVMVNLYENLADYNGSSTVPLPVEAQSWTVANNSQEFVFHIRPDVYFSNGDNVTAYTIWFSYVRELVMNAPSTIGASNWNLLTMDVSSDWFTATCGNTEPWGLVNGLSSVSGIQLTATNCGRITSAVSGMLSAFNPGNATQQAIMAYQHQAYTAPNDTTFILRTMRPYPYTVSDLAGWSGTGTVDPAFVDAHGGVQNNTANSYLNNNCEPGTGPYVCKSVGTALSELVLVKNPHYWAAGSGPNELKPGLPWFIRPGQIPIIDIRFGITGSALYEDFGTNVAAIGPAYPSFSIPEWGQQWSAYQYKNFVDDNLSRLLSIFPGAFFEYLGMNSQRFPTNMTDFRQAVYWAMNYSALVQTEVEYNGTAYGSLILGPARPDFGSLYNPGNLPLPKQNLSIAIHYLDLAGKQANFYVVLPNGTVIGNPNGSQLPPLELVYIAPLSPTLAVQLEIYQESMSAIGIPVTLVGETQAVYYAQSTNPSTAPLFSNIGWGMDYPDLWLQEYVCFYTTNCGFASYINNSTLTNLIDSAAFNPSSAQQLQADKEIYGISAQEAYYIWLPFSDEVFWIQPYLQGFIWNAYNGGNYYNLMHYQPLTIPAG